MRKVKIKLEYPGNVYCTIFGEAAYPNIPSDMEETLEHILKTFTQRETDMFMLKYRYKLTNREISSNYGISSSRVREIIAKTLRKLRHKSRSKILKIGREAYLNLIDAEKEKEKKIYCNRIKELNKLIQEYTKEITDCQDKLDKLDKLYNCEIDFWLS